MKRRTLLISIASMLGACSQQGANATQPAAPKREEAPLRLSLTRLLSPDYLFEERLSDPLKLANYINALIAAASEQLKTKPAGIGFSGQIFCLVKPERKAQYWLISKTPERLAPYETALLSALKTVTVPNITDGPLALTLLFDAWEGGPDFTDTPMIIPDAWLSALPEGDRLYG